MPAGLKILVVDDNPTILKLVCRGLEKCGELVTASDGADALMKAIEIKPHLIISDYSMPVMDGRALFEKLRARKETQNIPFVFLASQKEIDERLRMVVDGVEDYFVKPFFVRELVRQARRITARLLQSQMETGGCPRRQRYREAERDEPARLDELARARPEELRPHRPHRWR